MNQFFPLNYNEKPRRTARFVRDSIDSCASENLSPRLNLAPILEEYSVFEEVSESNKSEKSEDSASESSKSDDPPHTTMAMDENNYKVKFANLKKELRQVEARIDSYTPEDATLADRDIYKEHLGETRNKYVSCYESLRDLIEELDEDVDQARVAQLKQILKDLTDKFKLNDKQVKEKFEETISEYETSKTLSVKEKIDIDLMKLKEEKVTKEKIQVRMRNGWKKSKQLVKTIMNIKTAQEMTEAEIRENIIESTKWETKIEEISRVKEIIEDELVSVHVDPELKENYDNSFLEALDIGETKFRALNLEDKKFGIFTNAPSKVKGNIVYPDPFHGRPGDNVYKFTKLFKEALDADQVRTSDQLKTLLKYLKGEANVAVGEQVTELKMTQP